VSVKVSLAGRVSISTDGVVIDEKRFPGRQGRLVFAYLVSEHGRPVTRDELAEALWGETLPATWEKALGGIASKLRALLGECGLDGAKLLTNAFGCYRLDLPEGTSVDVVVAARGVDAAEAALAAGQLDRAKAEAREAAALARLPLLSGEDGAWVQGRRRELADVLDRALGCLAAACLRSGDASEAAKWAQEAIALEPFRESGYRRLMHAHAAAGNRAEALRAYERCRRLLSEELGAYPSPETESIYRELLRTSTDEARAAALPETGLVSATVAPPVAEQPHTRDVAVLSAAREGEPAGTAAEQIGSRRRPPRRRVMAAATLAGAAVAAAVGVLVTQGSGSPASSSVGANEVAVIDSESGKVLSEIAVGTAPGEVAAGRDAVWVTNSSNNSVSRIDLSTSDVRQTIQVGAGPAGVAAGGGAVWVANGLDGTVSRIDPTANQVVQTIAVGNGPSGVAYGERNVWVTNSADGTVSQIDPDSGKVRRTLPAVIGASGVAVGFDRVWIVSPPSGSVVALDPGSGQVLQRIGVGVDPDAVAVGAGAVWVANRADGTVSKFDPSEGAVTDTVRVGRGPNGIAAGPGGVWVANGADGTLSRIDPSNGATLKTVRLGNPPGGVAFSPQGVYVAARSTGVEHRGGTLRVLPNFSVDSIDLALSTPNIWSVLTMTNDGLVGFRRVGGVQGTQLVPDLAVSLPTPTDSGKAYLFQVRPRIRYANGEPVQPDDFKRAIERLLEIGDRGGGGNAYYYGGIVGADHCAKGQSCDLSRGIVTDRATRTVTFHLTAPDADFLAKLALPSAFAVPAGVPMHDVGTQPIPATGPYRIAEYRKETKTLRLVRNRSFREWSADAQPQGYPESVSLSWRFGLDTAAQVRAVERGAADVALSGPPISSPAAKQQLDVLSVRYPNQLHVNAQLGTTFFFLNTRVPPFDDARVRRALNTAFDREVFAQQLGRAFAATCRILPPNFPGYRPECPYPPRGVTRLDTARRLVRSSGTAGVRVTVWMPSPIAEQARYMVSVLDSLGYRARVKAVDPDAYYGKVTDSRVRAQVGYYTWFAGYPSAADFIPPQLSCRAFVPASPERSSNLSEFCDHSIDAQMARAAAVQVQDPAAATALWQQVEQSLLAQAPVVPTYNRRNIDFVSRRVGNYQYNPQWGFLLDQAWVK
jgi:peptide/nickel transport system substrate-binding protein